MEREQYRTKPPVDGPVAERMEYKSDPRSTSTSSPLLRQAPSKASFNEPGSVPNVTFKAKALAILPLVVHFMGSLATVAALLYWLDHRPFYTKRTPRIKLANGTETSDRLDNYSILQSDVVTILSGTLMVLRWVAGAWTGPLCWRALILLAERQGVRRTDVKWITSIGILPLSRRFLNPPTFMVAGILILSLIPFPASPLLTGSITWISGTHTLDDSRISINPVPFTGLLDDLKPSTSMTLSRGSYAFFETHVVRTHYLAWGQKGNEEVIKRVTNSVANLSIGSTVRDIAMPYLEVTQLDWLSAPDNDIYEKLYAMQSSRFVYPALLEKLSQPGAAALLNTLSSAPVLPRTVTLILNVVQSGPDGLDLGASSRCESSALVTKNTTIPYFNLTFNFTTNTDPAVHYTSCFSYVKMTLKAGIGYCHRCRVTSYSTVQNETALDPVTAGEADFDSASMLVHTALMDIPQYLPTLTPFKDSLPDPLNNGLEAYAQALLTRSYSALWNTWTDMMGYDSPPLTLRYQPAYPTLTAEVNKARAYTWLALQLSATVAGMLFLCLQGNSKHHLPTDTRMVVFDLDSTEVSIPNESSEKNHKEIMRFEWCGDRWKAVVKRSRVGEDEE